MEEIEVFDNFLLKEELNTAIDIISKGSWKFNHVSRGDHLYETPFWTMELEDNVFFSITLKKVLEKHFSKKFKIKRLYANGQTFGQDGSFHIDTADKTEINKYTFVLYLTDISKENIELAGGNIYFKFDDLYKYNICYEPIFNRGIFFPSHFLHKANAFSRYILDLRISVAWKLEEIFE